MKRVWTSVKTLYFLLACIVANPSLVYAVKTLYIGGLFPITGSSVASAGKSLLSISELAIGMVNNRSDLLPGYRLQLLWNDTKCDPGYATNVLFESLYNRPPMIMLLGAACSSATRATAQTGKLWNLLQVSYASTASDLSNKDKYPLLYSIVPPESAQNNARVAFLKHFQWKRIATIRQNEYVFHEVMDMFQENLLNDGFELISAEIFSDDHKSHVKNLKKSDARIIVGMFYEDQARKVICEAYKQGMYGEHYMWLLLDWYDNKQWWLVKDGEVDCTEEQMSQAVQGYFSIESARIVSNREPTISKFTSEKFLQIYDKPNKNRTDLYVPFAFDSVWVIAMTLNNSIHEIHTKLNRSLEDFNYKDSEMTQILKNTMENMEFQGITGNIKFTETGERTRPTCIKQMQGGSSKVVGMYFPDTDKIVLNGTKVIWHGGKPPSDGKTIIYEMQYVSTPLFCVIVIFASAGILLALFFLWFNITKRNHSYIKLSSPNVNNVVIVGCVFIYISVYMIAIDGKIADKDALEGLCMARGYLLSIGYSLAVGALFSKTWRVYQVFSNVKPKRKIFTDWELTGVILFLVLVDILVMSLWIGVDTPEIITTTLESQVKEEPHQRIIPQEQYCSSKYFTTWLYILLGYKVLLLLIGCFFAWVTRKVKVHSLNDSRFVCVSVYNIVLCTIVGIPLSFLIDGHMNALVACMSFFLLLPSTVTLCLLFVPKFIKLKNNVEELLRLQSLSSIRTASTNTAGASNGSIECQPVDDPNVITRLQEEIATLKQEIRAMKANHNEQMTTKISMSARIADPVENGRAGRMFTQSEISPTPRPFPRPQLGKRSVTCNTAEELGVKMMRRRRSSSFSGPYLRHRSLDLGSLYSELADPVLVLKAENKELNRKLQEARISETGKLAKVLYKNAQLNRQIVELNEKNTPSSEAEKVSRLVKENAELKKQLGEVSILNSVWCDVTPRLQRKQKEERKISKDLRELQHLLNIDLGGRRHGSFNPSSLSRPPPIGRSQSSSDIQINRNSTSPSDKKPISPLARDEAKRFSFDSVSKKQDFRAKDPRTGIQVTVSEADKSLSRPESPQFETMNSTSSNAVRRDNIDGCESEKEISDVRERTNAGFSDEDEGVQDDKVDVKNFNSSKDCKNEIRNTCTSRDAKEQLKGSVNHGVGVESDYWTIISVQEPLRATDGSKDSKDSFSFQGISEQLGATFAHQTVVPSINEQNDPTGVLKGHFSSANPDKPVSAPKSDFILGKSGDIPSSVIITNCDALLDQNGNSPSSDERVQVKVAVNSSDDNSLFEENGTISSQGRERVKSFDKTLDSGGHDADLEGREYPPNKGSPKDVPAYKRKQNRRKDKSKNDKIEKTFFV